MTMERCALHVYRRPRRAVAGKRGSAIDRLRRCFQPSRFGSSDCKDTRSDAWAWLPACVLRQQPGGEGARWTAFAVISSLCAQQRQQEQRANRLRAAESMAPETPLLRRCTASAAFRGTTCDRGGRCPAQGPGLRTEHLVRSLSHGEPPAQCRFPAPNRLRWRWRAYSRFRGYYR